MMTLILSIFPSEHLAGPLNFMYLFNC